jgi:uncharacterized membrane protein YdjX (TVP38/TMEM64 family)
MRRIPRALILVLVLVALLWSARALGFSRHVTVADLRALVDSAAPFGPLAFMAVCIGGILLHLPEIAFIAVGGVLFGRFEAFAYGWLACVVGTMVTFGVVRAVARDGVTRAGDRFARLRAFDERLASHGFVTVLVLRLALFLAPPLNWMLGATRVRFRDYVAGTALGIMPGIAGTVFFADTIVNRPPDSPLVSARLVLGALLVIALVVTVATASRRLVANAPAPPPR